MQLETDQHMHVRKLLKRGEGVEVTAPPPPTQAESSAGKDTKTVTITAAHVLKR